MDLFKAKLAEKSERYQDMLESMKKYATEKSTEKKVLAADERNLLSVAFKNIVGERRNSWKVLRSRVDSATGDEKVLAEEYMEMIRKELDDICNDAIRFLDENLINDTQELAAECEAKVFYLKMKGDYLRYKCEYTKGDEDLIEKSLTAYRTAEDCAATNLDGTHPIKLGLALNFSVFFYEIKNDQAQACKTAKEAFDQAINLLDSMSEDHYKDSTLIMQLLRDNLTLWTSEEGDEEGPQ